jgi:DNA-directed RNA polymerase III subunit RPC1
VQDANKQDLLSNMSSAFERNAELEKLSEKALDDLNPARVFRLFQRVLDLDLPLLGIACRPEHLLITYLAVPPVCIRPSVEMDTGAGSNEDDATTRLLAVCDMSISIRKNLEKGIAPWETVMEQWDFLQVLVSILENPMHTVYPCYNNGPGRTKSCHYVKCHFYCAR